MRACHGTYDPVTSITAKSITATTKDASGNTLSVTCNGRIIAVTKGPYSDTYGNAILRSYRTISVWIVGVGYFMTPSNGPNALAFTSSTGKTVSYYDSSVYTEYSKMSLSSDMKTITFYNVSNSEPYYTYRIFYME